MKSLLDFKLITEEEKKDYSKFDALVRAGLANKAQMQRIHKILDKMGDERPTFNPADRAIMQNLFNRMVDLISNNKQIYSKAKQAVREELNEVSLAATSDVPFIPDPPAVLVIKRRAVRLYPDGTRVALYYSDKLKRYFTVPYATMSAGVSAIQAENFINELRSSSKLTEDTTLELQDGSQVELDALMVNRIVYAYDGLEEENKEKFIELLTSSEESFDKAYEFCRSHYSV
jgi:hypothetical protein